MDIERIVLSDQLIASSKGKQIESKYRAVLIIDPFKRHIVTIEQPSGGEWHGCGRWALSTLLYGHPLCLGHKPSDSLSIDFGQQWQIDHGIHAALLEAINHI